MKKLISCVLALVLMLSLVPSAFAASKPQVCLSRQNITVNGKQVTGLEVYTIDGYNYFKLRDVAYLLKDTDSSISVNYNQAANAVRFGNGRYTPVGGECEFDGVDKSASAVPSTQKFVASIRPEGAAEASYIVVYPSAYSIGGNNFLKLRDILSCIESTATVDWDDATKTIVLKSIDYKGSHEEQAAYDFAKCTESWNKELLDATIAVIDSLKSQGKLLDTMSLSERADVFRAWVKQFPNQNKEYHGFYYPSASEQQKSIIIDGNALNSDCYKQAFCALFWIDCYLRGMTEAEIQAANIHY